MLKDKRWAYVLLTFEKWKRVDSGSHSTWAGTFSPQGYEKMCVPSRELVLSSGSASGLGQGWGRNLEVISPRLG